MMDKSSKLEALKAIVESGDSGGGMRPHKVTCPNCGHKWTMGEESSMEDGEEEEYED